ncbi:MAG: VWA-like domain-containing protein [Rhodomicrobium sp.]
MPDTRMPGDHRGTRAIQRMVEFAPSTGGLALWVKHHDHPPTSDAPIVTTDGNALFYGVSFEALPVAEQAGLVAHEVLHIALRHPQRYLELQQLLGDVDLKLYTICADAIVNSSLSHLSWLRLPRGSVYLHELLSTALGVKRDAQSALLEWDVERLYRAIDDREATPQSGKKDERRKHDGGGEKSEDGKDEQASASRQTEDRKDGSKASRARAMGASVLMDLVPAPDPNAPPEAEAQQALLWSERLQRSHASDGMHSMLRSLLADLPKVRTPWEQALRTQLARGLSKKIDISWSRPARSYIANQGWCGNSRMPFEPGFSMSKPTPRLVVIVDVSGSVDDKLLERFASQIEAITRRQEAGLTLIIGDDRVRKVEQYKPGVSDLRKIEFQGRGDTDFTPLLIEAEKYRPDIAVVLTDLDGPAGFRPRWPVIWAVPEEHRDAPHPFGRKLVLS